MKEVDLTLWDSGVAVDLFNEELRKVLANIADNNVKAEAVRKIKIEFSLKPDNSRRLAAVSVTATSTLAPVQAHKGIVFFDSGKDGKIGVYQDDPAQLELDGSNTVFEMPKEGVR